MGKTRTPIGKFINSAWTNMNIRAGKYRHLGNAQKNKTYKDINIEFTREEFKTWCLSKESYILSLKRPSIDRKNSYKNYTLENIQILELDKNIQKKRPGNSYINGDKHNRERGIRKTKSGKYQAILWVNSKIKCLGSYSSKKEALKIYHDSFVSLYGIEPFCYEAKEPVDGKKT